MRRRDLVLGLLAAVALIVAVQVWAFPEMSLQTKTACAACHVNPAGGADLTEPGKAYQADNKKVPQGKVEGAEYVGNKRCKMCHSKEHKSWLDTQHAKAFEAFESKEGTAAMAAKLKVELKGPATKEAGCVSCHVTGYKLAGGYPAADSAATAAVTGVTCESCHGPGSIHVKSKAADKKATINRDASAKMCQQCHTATTSPKFAYDEYLKRALHVLKASN